MCSGVRRHGSKPWLCYLGDHWQSLPHLLPHLHDEINSSVFMSNLCHELRTGYTVSNVLSFCLGPSHFLLLPGIFSTQTAGWLPPSPYSGLGSEKLSLNTHYPNQIPHSYSLTPCPALFFFRALPSPTRV